MKLDWRTALIFFALAALLDFGAKGSNVPGVVGLEALGVFFLALISVAPERYIVIFFICLSFISDLIALRPAGLTSLSVFLGYLIVKTLNKVFTLSGEGRYLFGLAVVFTLSLIRPLIQNIYLGNEEVAASVFSLLLNLFLYSLAYIFSSQLFTARVFKR